MPQGQYNLNHNHEQRTGQAAGEHKAMEHQLRRDSSTAQPADHSSGITSRFRSLVDRMKASVRRR